MNKSKQIIGVIVILLIIMGIGAYSMKKNSGISNRNDIPKNDIQNSQQTTTLSDIQKIKTLQLESGRDYITTLNCGEYESEAQRYCKSEQQELAFLKNTITWESVLNQGNDIIKTYDCNQISLDLGKQHCKDYQRKINTPILDFELEVSDLSGSGSQLEQEEISYGDYSMDELLEGYEVINKTENQAQIKVGEEVFTIYFNQ